MAGTFNAPFTVLGQCKHTGAASGRFEPNNNRADCGHAFYYDGRWHLQATVFDNTVTGVLPGKFPQFPSRSSVDATLSRSGTPSSPPAFCTQWTPNLDASNEATYGIPNVPGTMMEDGVDTALMVWSPPLERWLTYFTMNPGPLPNTYLDRGRVFVIGVAMSGEADFASRSWQLFPDTPARLPLQPWEAPFGILDQKSGVTLWDGGVTEPSVIYNQDTGFMVMFTSAVQLSGSVRSQHGMHGLWTVGRAVSTDGGLTFPFSAPAEPVFYYIGETPESGWGNNGQRALQPHVTLDPDGRRLHMVFVGGELGDPGSFGIGHAYSDDWGLTWVRNPINPLVQVQGPAWTFEPGETAYEEGDRVNNPILEFDPLNPGQALLFFDRKPAASRPSTPLPSGAGGPHGGIWVAEGTLV